MSLIKLQEKIGVTPDGSFGPKTLKAIRDYFNLSDEQVAHFCGQVAHETGDFQLFSENLNYSASGLLRTFGKYFTKVTAELYARQPKKIASRVYGGRMGNGNEASMEGWLFRGRGALQTTGKANYTAFAKYLGSDEIMENPNLVAELYSFESAIFFFEKNKLWLICDRGVSDASITALSKRVNGGENGLADRISLTKRFYSWLK